MKSEARLGERAPSTSTPSTGLERSSAGDPEGPVAAGAGYGALMVPNLGETTDRPRDERADEAFRGRPFG
jgi:hypothetical protein